MTKIIAEIGWNHMGDMNLAKKMIIAAKDNGADFVKTQIFNIKYLKDGPWMTDGRKEIYEKAQLTNEKYNELVNFGKENDINFFTSVFNTMGAQEALKINNDIIKIPSTESRNVELLKFCNKNFKKVLVSTGTSTEKEMIDSKTCFDDDKAVFLHCVSAYPCDEYNSNLPRINFIKTLSKQYGYSDHTTGTEVSKISLEYNIDYLEKHFTTDNSLPGRDNKFAILPKDLKELVKYKEKRMAANKFHGNDFIDSEKEQREIYTGRWG